MAKRDCRHLHSPGETVALKLLPTFDDQAEQHIAHAVASLFGELAPAVEAIAADLILTHRRPEEPFLERNEVSSPPAFHLREAQPSPHVRTVIEGATDPQLPVTQVPRLDASTVERFIQHSIRHSAPPSGYVMTLDVMRVRFSRARLFSVGSVSEKVFPVHQYDEVLEVPIEWRAGEAWVSGPVGWVSMLAPVAFEIINNDGALHATLWVGWSYWAERNHPEHDALEQALRRIFARGWTPELVPPSFDLGAKAGAQGPHH